MAQKKHWLRKCEIWCTFLRILPKKAYFSEEVVETSVMLVTSATSWQLQVIFELGGVSFIFSEI